MKSWQLLKFTPKILHDLNSTLFSVECGNFAIERLQWTNVQSMKLHERNDVSVKSHAMNVQ